MPLPTRRQVLYGLSSLIAGTTALGGYALGIEPMRTVVTRYQISPPGWPSGLALRVAVLTDIHACEPWMSAERIARIVHQTNLLKPDITVLLGDFVVASRFITRRVPIEAWVDALKGLEAPLGVHAVLGNHDWWGDAAAQMRRRGPTVVGQALEKKGIPVYENAATRLEKDGQGFWIAGLADQVAISLSPRLFRGLDDLDGTLAKVTDGAPVILLAHEPDIFVRVPERVSLTLSGHTHGGQVRLFGYSPVVPSRYGNRFAYGHIVEQGRHLVVSGGLGCSKLPVRFGVPPEIVVIDVAGATA